VITAVDMLPYTIAITTPLQIIQIWWSPSKH